MKVREWLVIGGIGGVSAVLAVVIVLAIVSSQPVAVEQVAAAPAEQLAAPEVLDPEQAWRQEHARLQQLTLADVEVQVERHGARVSRAIELAMEYRLKRYRELTAGKDKETARKMEQTWRAEIERQAAEAACLVCGVRPEYFWSIDPFGWRKVVFGD